MKFFPKKGKYYVQVSRRRTRIGRDKDRLIGRLQARVDANLNNVLNVDNDDVKGALYTFKISKKLL